MTTISGSAAAVTGAGVLTNIVRNSRTSAAITDNTRRAQSIDRFDAVAKTTPPIAAQRIILGIEKNQPPTQLQPIVIPWRAKPS
jgi:hypothetical protein